MAAPLRDAVLAALAARSPLALFLDVDGTLAPIAPTPADARVPDDTRAAVARLAALSGVRVALVTGRAAADARAMVGVAGVWAVGNHGVERLAPDGTHGVEAEAARFGGALARARDALVAASAELEGVTVEDKRWSLAVHYRQAPRDVVAPLRERVRSAARADGLVVRDGKEVFELRAPVEIDKGTAVLALAETLGAREDGAGILFVGDDTTDEDAFRRLAEHAPEALTVRVGPPDVRTAARFVVDDPAAVRDLLVGLARLRDR